MKNQGTLEIVYGWTESNPLNKRGFIKKNGRIRQGERMSDEHMITEARKMLASHKYDFVCLYRKRIVYEDVPLFSKGGND